MEESEYIEKWIDVSISLSEWLSQRNIDHWEIIEQLGLSESQIEEIEQHQHSLFNQAVKNSVNNRIDSYQESVKITVFTEHLRIIDLFLKSSKVEPFLIELLKPIVSIKEKNYLDTLVAFQNILAHRYNDFKTDFSINQNRSFLDGNYFNASIINEYKGAIEKYFINTSSKETAAKKSELKVKQIALIYIYNGEQITRDNASQIASKYGYTSKNSGEGLFQDYTEFCSTANRKGKPTPFSPKKLQNKIDLFESVVNYLSKDGKRRALDEIATLKSLVDYENQ